MHERKLDNFKEQDMYQPIKKFFASLGYDVKAEVKNCDIALLKSERLIVIEMKKSFNITLLYQAIDRQRLADEVYMAIPRPKPKRASRAELSKMLHIVKALGLGLITVAMDSPVKSVQILAYPEQEATLPRKSLVRRKSVIKEAGMRTLDLNFGGSNKEKLVTAFRERALQLAVAISMHGPLKAAQLVKDFGCDKNSNGIMYRNYYGWFERMSGGVYGLSGEGQSALADEHYAELVEHYKAILTIDKFTL